jgi:hypothetical protein
MRIEFKNFSARLDSAAILIFMGIAYAFYRHYDPVEMLTGDIHPWDSWHYRGLSNQMLANGLNGLSESRPFCYRIVQPALASMARILSGATYSEASHAVNIICTVLATLFCFHLWRRLGLSRAYAYSGVAILTLSWLGPLRYSIFYPGGQFAFEILVTCASFWALREIYLAGAMVDYLLPVATMFLATLGRENILYLAIICSLMLCLPHGKVRSHSPVASVLASIMPSLAGYLAARALVQGEGEYSILSTVLSFGWFHLHIGEVLYMFFYSYGPFFLFFLICITFSVSRKAFLEVIRFGNSVDNKLITGFCAVSIIFALIGGTDSDRFLLWALPFFYFWGLASLRAVMARITADRQKIAVLSAFIVAASLWSRFYVPAIPHLLFTDKYNSQAGVKTNLNPSLYQGVPLLLPMREKLAEVPASDAYNSERIGSRSSLPRAFVSQKLAELYPGKSTDTDGSTKSLSPYKFSYRLSVNNVPFPLGFAHNQNELLAIHPYHGSARLRAILLIQWIAVYAILVILLYRNGFTANRK